MSGETMRTPVTTFAELDTLDDDEILEGYRDGFAGEAEPGNNRSKSYWHGWRNGAIDKGYLKPDAESFALAREYVERTKP